MNRSLFYGMLGLGGVLIVAGFFLFLQDVQSAGLFALNLTTSLVVFTVCFTRVLDFGAQADMRVGYAGLGLRWLAVLLFSAASLALIVCSIVFQLSVTLCFWLQLVLLFLTGMMLLGAKTAADSAAGTLARMEGEMDVLKQLKAQLTLMELAADGTAFAAEARASVAKLNDEVNFLTVSQTPTAKVLEEELAVKFRMMTDRLKDPEADIAAFDKEVEASVSILRVRRQQRYK